MKQESLDKSRCHERLWHLQYVNKKGQARKIDDIFKTIFIIMLGKYQKQKRNNYFTMSSVLLSVFSLGAEIVAELY